MCYTSMHIIDLLSVLFLKSLPQQQLRVWQDYTWTNETRGFQVQSAGIINFWNFSFTNFSFTLCSNKILHEIKHWIYVVWQKLESCFVLSNAPYSVPIFCSAITNSRKKLSRYSWLLMLQINYCFSFSLAMLSNMLHNTRFHRSFVIKPCKIIIRALCEMSNRKKVHRGTRWKSIRANQLDGLAESKPLWESQHWGWHCWVSWMKTWLTPCKISNNQL